jgi:hypothetical protein
MTRPQCHLRAAKWVGFAGRRFFAYGGFFAANAALFNGVGEAEGL